MAGQRGWVKVDEVKYKDGRKIAIRLKRSSGEFKAVIHTVDKDGGDDVFGTPVFISKSKDLEEVRRELLAYFQDTDSIGWEPIIIIKGIGKFKFREFE